VLSADPHTGRPTVTPEAIRACEARLVGLATSRPAALRLVVTRPWSVGGPLLLLAGWLCFACPPPLFPAWAAAAWLLNGYATRELEAGAPPSPWEPRRAEGYQQYGGSSPEERLEALERCALPLLARLDRWASAVERVLNTATIDDPRASILAVLPAALILSASSAILALVWGLAWLAGGPAAFLFELVTIALLWNAARFHRNELLAWLGSQRGGLDGAAAAAPDERERLRPKGTADSAAGDERQAAVASALRDLWVSVWASVAAVASNLWHRLPDGPMRAHRAIARAALQSDTGAVSRLAEKAGTKLLSV